MLELFHNISISSCGEFITAYITGTYELPSALTKKEPLSFSIINTAIMSK